ncbi:MAG: hypothetical protein WAQ08_08300 [Aquabacterium sp.]|jgi:pimeloyl-ACP methyl ester carboxylesterase
MERLAGFLRLSSQPTTATPNYQPPTQDQLTCKPFDLSPTDWYGWRRQVIKRRHGASRLVLVGYSGGGAVAALLAARRADVVALVTVAGNLDHQAWTSLHGIRPLDSSLNPIDQAGRLARLRQWHLVGEQDRVVPADLVRAFVARQGSGAQATVIVELGFGHACCWAQQWPRLWTSLALPH